MYLQRRTRLRHFLSTGHHTIADRRAARAELLLRLLPLRIRRHLGREGVCQHEHRQHK